MEALDRQEPFINQPLAVSSLAMLARLLRYGQISYHGGFYNAETGRIAALPVEPDEFARMLGIPVKVNAYSGGKPNGVPVGS